MCIRDRVLVWESDAFAVYRRGQDNVFAASQGGLPSMSSQIAPLDTENTETQQVHPPLLFALPKGRLADQSLELLNQAGLSVPTDTNSRKLVLSNNDGSIGFVLSL